jgi:hypothetical protein
MALYRVVDLAPETQTQMAYKSSRDGAPLAPPLSSQQGQLPTVAVASVLELSEKPSFVARALQGLGLGESPSCLRRSGYMILADFSADAQGATAVGTLLLAIATYLLARRAASEVRAANEQARASAAQSAASTLQAEAAERAVAVQTAPLLADVPFGIPVVTGYRIKSRTGRISVMEMMIGDQEPTYRDASEIRIFIDETGYKEANIEVPFRNVGNGPAVIDAVTVVIAEGCELVGHPSTPIVPSGEIASAEMAISPGVEGYDVAHSAITNRAPFSVLIAYGDARGEPFGAMRMDIAPLKRPPDSDDWLVRQVHWGDTAQEVGSEPRLSSVVAPG